MRYFCVLIFLCCACCIGCKNNPKYKDIPVPKLLSDADVRFFHDRIQDSVIVSIMDTIKGFQRVDFIYASLVSTKGSMIDTMSVYSNATDTVMIWRSYPVVWVRSFVIRSEKPDIIDLGIKVGAPMDVFLDRFRKVYDFDTVEIVENQLDREYIFTAILYDGKIKSMRYRNKSVQR